jgi:TctA family transporter
MTDIVHLLALGFGAALTPSHLWYCFLGAAIGTFIGVLPGLGPIATMAMLLPLTYYLQPTGALIMLAGIYYGSQYGGSTTAILMRLPGESSSVVTCIDGYEMARRGRAGAALATAALASFFAGTFSTLLIAFFSPPLTAVAQKFGPAEYFSLMVLGLIAAVVFAHGSPLRSISMIFLGLLLGLVGADVNTGLNRFTFGVPELRDGIGIAVVSMGVFGIAEIVLNLTKKEAGPARKHEISTLRITRSDFRLAWPAAVRGTAIGAMLGILPGGGAMIGSFAAYSVEKRLSRTPERFGQGAIEGVAAPEAANNAGAQASFIPMLALGIPSNSVMAMMAGAMLIHGIAPSPNLATAQPELFWGLIVSMWIGNLMLLAINLPLIRLWVYLLAVPYGILFPAILVFCCIGIYTVNTSAFEIALMAGFGVLGVILALLRCPPAPLVLAFILGPMMEENLRRAMLLSGGNAGVFLNPISLAFLAAAIILLALILLPSFRTVRAVAAEE